VRRWFGGITADGALDALDVGRRYGGGERDRQRQGGRLADAQRSAEVKAALFPLPNSWLVAMNLLVI
jgi:hypothetical protein